MQIHMHTIHQVSFDAAAAGWVALGSRLRVSRAYAAYLRVAFSGG
jgi:hypothetical protein